MITIINGILVAVIAVCALEIIVKRVVDLYLEIKNKLKQ